MPEPFADMTLLPVTTVAVCVVCACVPSELLRLALYGEGLAPPLFAVPLIVVEAPSSWA